MSETSTLPDDWELVRLADQTTVKARLGWKGLKAEEYVEDGYIFLATPNLKAHQIDFDNVNYITKWRYDESPEIQLHLGDVLIVKDGSTLGISNFVRHLPRPTTVNGSIAVVRTRSSLNPEFLYHLVNGQSFQYLIASKKAGLGVPHLFQADLREFFVALPPLPQQRKIARILTTLDNVITQTEALIAKYQAIKQGLMHDLFTRGVDATGKLRPPQSEAPELYKQSKLGWIPKEWEVERLVNRITLPQGQVDPRQHPYRDWILVAPDHIEQRTGRLLARQSASEQGAISGKYEFNVGDVVYSKIRPYLRKAVLATEHGICSADMYPLRPLHGVRPRYLLGIVLGEHFSRFAEAVSERSGFPKINRSELAEYDASFPDLDEQDRICRIVQSHERQIQREQILLSKYKQQKTGLMQDLLTGEVPVKADEPEEIAAHA